MPTDDLWTAEDAARQVGVEPSTLYTWVRRGYLRHAGTDGRLKKFRLDDVFRAERERKHKHRRRDSR